MVVTLNDNVVTMLHEARIDNKQSVKLLSMLKCDQRNVETSNLISDLASEIEVRISDGEI